MEKKTSDDRFIPWEISNLSTSHIYSAALFARKVKEIEMNTKPTEYYLVGSFERSEHTSYAIACVVFSVAFLEASINELIKLIHIELEERYAESSLKIDQQSRNLISKLWDLGIPRKARLNTLEKYNYLSILIRNEEIDRNSKTYENIGILFKLRNYLVHFVPEKIEIELYEDDKVELHKLGKSLKGKFELNPFSSTPFFPNQCISYGCSRWAILNVITFFDEFMISLGKPEFCKYIKKDIDYENFV